MTTKDSESILASYATYKELYASDNYKSAYQILAEFIKYLIVTEKKYSFSVSQLKKELNEVFGFQLPDAVIKSTIKKLEFVTRQQASGDYTVDYKNIKVDSGFTSYREKAERDNSFLTEELIKYAQNKTTDEIDNEELIQELVAYLLDKSNGGKYQEVISAFILENSENTKLVNQLNTIREGSILYMGLNCNISEIGSISQALVLYLDMEILFDIYGYNGEVYKSLSGDLIDLVKEANKASKKIKLKYFEDTKNDISSFFLAAEEIVKNGVMARENVAMKTIIDGCKNVTDVRDKEADFFHSLQYEYNIIMDDKKTYYSEEDKIANLEDINVIDDEQKNALKCLSNINKLRKNQDYNDYSRVGYIFVTETWKTLELAKKIVDEKSSNQDKVDEGICRLAVSMNFLTNFLWYKLNKGFGATNYPRNLDSVIKAKIILTRFIAQNVTNTFNKYKDELDREVITTEQMAGRLVGLKEKASKPEEITADNLQDNLNFDEEYLSRYVVEHEYQKTELKEKLRIIEQLEKNSRKSEDELRKIRDIAENGKAEIMNQNLKIVKQEKELEILTHKLEKYEREEEEKERKKEYNAKVRKFIFVLIKSAIIIIVILVVLNCVLIFFWRNAVEANNFLTLICNFGTVVVLIFGIINFIKKEHRKIFHNDANKR